MPKFESPKPTKEKEKNLGNLTEINESIPDDLFVMKKGVLDTSEGEPVDDPTVLECSKLALMAYKKFIEEYRQAQDQNKAELITSQDIGFQRERLFDPESVKIKNKIELVQNEYYKNLFEMSLYSTNLTGPDDDKENYAKIYIDTKSKMGTMNRHNYVMARKGEGVRKEIIGKYSDLIKEAGGHKIKDYLEKQGYSDFGECNIQRFSERLKGLDS